MHKRRETKKERQDEGTGDRGREKDTGKKIGKLLPQGQNKLEQKMDEEEHKYQVPRKTKGEEKKVKRRNNVIFARLSREQC